MGKQCQGALPVLCTSISNKVAIPDPDKRAEVQHDLNHATGCLSVVFVFALLEHYDFNISNKWLKDDEKLTLKAWKHVRHSASHGLNGVRADRYADEFNEIMSSQYPLPCIESWNTDQIIVQSLFGFKLLQYMSDLAQHLQARAASA